MLITFIILTALLAVRPTSRLVMEACDIIVARRKK